MYVFMFQLQLSLMVPYLSILPFYIPFNSIDGKISSLSPLLGYLVCSVGRPCEDHSQTPLRNRSSLLLFKTPFKLADAEGVQTHPCWGVSLRISVVGRVSQWSLYPRCPHRVFILHDVSAAFHVADHSLFLDPLFPTSFQTSVLVFL